MRVRPVPGLGAAALLAATTLGVFATFQNYGPESAVRRFHHGVATHDLNEIAQVVDSSPNASTVADLARFVAGAMAGGAYPRIVKSERTKTQVEMLALYNGRAVVWVVVKARDRWRIDPYLTLQGLKKLGY